jgi:hypothetical protein
MEQAPINFKQKRDFGEIFNATFSFIGQEFKPLGKAVLFYALPFLIVAAILSVFISIEQQKMTTAMQSATQQGMSDTLSYMGGVYKYMFLNILVFVFGITALRCTILGYIKLYIVKGKDQFTSEDIWNELKRSFLPVLGISILVSILQIIGTILCLVPGVILAVSLILIYAAYFFEDLGFGDAFNRSFKLTGQKWWLTFGLIIVLWILIYLIILLLSIPAILLGFKSLFGALKQEPQMLEFSTAFYIVNSITSLITYVLFSIPSIAMAFHYFSLVEMKERPSLQSKIDQIG